MDCPSFASPAVAMGGLEKVGGNIGGVTWQAKAEDSTSSICSPATAATGTCGNPCPVGRRQAGNGSDKSPRGSGILMSRIGVGGQWTISLVGWWPHHGSIKVDRSTGPLSSAKPNIIDFISPVLSVQFRLRTPQQSQGSLSHAAMPCVANTLAENAPGPGLSLHKPRNLRRLDRPRSDASVNRSQICASLPHLLPPCLMFVV